MSFKSYLTLLFFIVSFSLYFATSINSKEARKQHQENMLSTKKTFIYAQAYLPFIEEDLKSQENMCTVGKTNLNIKPMSMFDNENESIYKIMYQDSIRKQDAVTKDTESARCQYELDKLQEKVNKENENFAPATKQDVNDNCLYIISAILFCFAVSFLRDDEFM